LKKFQLKQTDSVTVWIAVSEDSVTLLELQTMAVMCRYNYANIVTFGGCLDDFMLVACPDEGAAEQKLLFALSKPKVNISNIKAINFKIFILSFVTCKLLYHIIVLYIFTILYHSQILEITLLIADYMNALGHALPGTPQMNTLTRNGSHRSIKSTLRPATGR